MKIAIDCGHTLSGPDAGATGNGFKEEIKTREIGSELINLFKNNNIEVINCTVDYSASVNDSLLERIREANNNNVDLYISIHLNAFNGQANGVETHIFEYALSKSYEYAKQVQSNLVKLGYVDRGIKRGNLYVLKYTNSPSILVECGFIDNKIDMNLYDANKIAKAIFIGITGIVPDASKTEQVFTNTDNWIARLQNECNKQGFSNQIVDGIYGPNTLDGCPTLTYGSSGNITKLLQEKLNSIGYNCGDIDGIFGGKTLRAITTYQVNNNLYADGIVGPNTWRTLFEM